MELAGGATGAMGDMGGGGGGEEEATGIVTVQGQLVMVRVVLSVTV
jgi:hypothetical protein